VLGALVAYPLFETDRRAPLLAVPAALAMVALIGALAGRWPPLLAAALALAGGEYAALLAVNGSLDLGATTALYAGGLLFVAELAFWSLEEQAAPDDRGLVLRRLAELLVLVAGAVFASALVLAASEVELGGGIGLEAVGVAAATATLALVAWLAARARAETGR
jgi:hypothetical protein